MSVDSFKYRKQVILMFCIVMAQILWAGGQLTSPQHLRVEHMVDPSVIDTRTPRLSWINMASDQDVCGASQHAYRIVVASSADKLNKGKYDVWDSGKVISSCSYLVNYAGIPLSDGEDYYWRVMVWDNNDKASGWSDVSRWGMGFIDPARWKARWIGAPWQGELPKNSIDPAKEQRIYPAPMLRKGFNITKKPVKAKAFITGLGYFELYVNGRRTGDDMLVPNFTNYGKRNDLDKYSIAIDDNFKGYRVMYLAYDVTDMLRQGNNAIGAILGNGFYDCVRSWVSPFGSPRLLCQLEITYADGSTETVVTDDSWKTAPSAILLDGPYDGEIYDARREINGWCDADFDDSQWSRAVYRKAPDGVLTAHTAPVDKVVERFAPTSLSRNANGSWNVKFPVEISGRIKLSGLKATPGSTVKVNYVCDQPLGVHHYIVGDDGEVNHAPRFTWYVFSQANITGVDSISAENIVAEAINTDVPVNSEFAASDPMLEQINTMWRRSQTDNMHGGVASDCPHRERSPYTGDGQVVMGTVMSNFDAAAFYTKWIRDMRDAQNAATGYVPNGAPWQPGCGGGVAWGAAMNIMPWEFYVYYGDMAMLRDNYPAMKAQVGYMQNWITEHGTMLQQRGNDNTSNPKPVYWLNLGDWCAPGTLPQQEAVHTFYLWRCLDYTARAAKALGFQADCDFYAAKAKDVADAFHKRFYNAEKKSYGDYGENVFALEMGVPADVLSDVVATLAHEIGQVHGGHLNTGIFATRYLFEQLGKNGLNDLAYTAMTARDFPGFGHWIEQGATVTWEEWDGKHSHNHPMFGGALMWFYTTLAGIMPDEEHPGFEHFTVRPVLAEKLPSVHYALMTPRGKLESTVSHDESKVELTVTVPVGAEATVMVPLPHEGMKVYVAGNSEPLQGRIQPATLPGTTPYFITTAVQGRHTFIAY